MHAFAKEAQPAAAGASSLGRPAFVAASPSPSAATSAATNSPHARPLLRHHRHATRVGGSLRMPAGVGHRFSSHRRASLSRNPTDAQGKKHRIEGSSSARASFPPARASVDTRMEPCLDKTAVRHPHPINQHDYPFDQQRHPQEDPSHTSVAVPSSQPAARHRHEMHPPVDRMSFAALSAAAWKWEGLGRLRQQFDGTPTVSAAVRSVAPPSMATGPPPGHEHYVVASGDTLQGIAAARGVPVETLQELNRGVVLAVAAAKKGAKGKARRAGGNATLMPGQVLVLPEPASAKPGSTGAPSNPLADAVNKLVQGVQDRIPAPSSPFTTPPSTSPPSPTKPAASSSLPPDAETPPDAPPLVRAAQGALQGLRNALPPSLLPRPAPPPPIREHRIVWGDTLATVADHYGVTVAELLAWNPGLRPNHIMTGQVLAVAPPTAQGWTPVKGASPASSAAAEGSRLMGKAGGQGVGGAGVGAIPRAGSRMREVVGGTGGSTQEAASAPAPTASLEGPSPALSALGAKLQEWMSRRSRSVATVTHSETYTIRRGDTLAHIAQSRGLELDAVLRLNPHITSEDGIMEGDDIMLPFPVEAIEETPAVAAGVDGSNVYAWLREQLQLVGRSMNVGYYGGRHGPRPRQYARVLASQWMDEQSALRNTVCGTLQVATTVGIIAYVSITLVRKVLEYGAEDAGENDGEPEGGAVYKAGSSHFWRH
eukprot:jgi/Mesvir1/1584/Mv14553-RA.1